MDTSPQFEENMLTVTATSAAAEVPSLPAAGLARNRARFERFTNASEMAADFLAVFAALLSAYGLYHVSHLGRQLAYSRSGILEVSGIFALICVWLLERSGAYRRESSLLLVKETERILRASMQAFLGALCLSLFTSHLISRWVIVLAFLFVPLFLILEKRGVASFVGALHSKGYGLRRVAIYGAGLTGRRIFSTLSRSRKLGFEPIVFVDDDTSLAGQEIFEAGYTKRRSIAITQGPLTRDWLRRNAVDLLVIAIPSIVQDKFDSIVNEASTAGVAISFVPHHFALWDHWINFVDLDGMLLASFERPESHDGYNTMKRGMDLVAGSILLVLASPLLLLIALAIRVTSSDPVLFVHERVGLNGKCFRMFKFRTMHVDAKPYAVSPQESLDPRITRLGQFLRRTSLDELPQLLNVIRGEMSLVGPRPEMKFIVEQYTQEQRQRLAVKPGITGLWQLSADRRFLIHQNIEYDLYYIRNRNFFMDMAILFHTLFFAMRGI